MSIKNLGSVSDAELEYEIARRKKAREAGERPRPLANPDLKRLIATTESHIESMETGEYHEDNDDAHYIYEEALKAVYGPKVFEWINKKCR